MPRIPTYESRLELPARSAGAKASLAVAALPGRALEQTGSEIGRFAEALHRAEQVEEMARAQVKAARALQDLQDSFNQRTDADNFEPEAAQAVKEIKSSLFAEIKDSEVKRRFAPDFDRLALTAQVNIRHRAQKLKVEHAQAQTINHIDELTKLYEKAPDTDRPRILGQIAGTIQAGAAAGLWTEVDALKMLKAKTKELRYAEALAEIDRDPDSFNPDKYRELDERARLELKRRAERLSASRLSQTLALIRFQQQQEDRRAKEQRDQVTTDFTVRALKGELTPQEVYDAAGRRIIKDEDVTKLVGLIEKTRQGKDDPWTKLYLTNEVLEGRASHEQVWEAYQEGMLTEKSAEGLIEKIHEARVKQPAIMRSPEYKMALDYIKTITNPPRSLLDHPDFASALREQYAKEEFYQRVVLNGEKIPQVVADIEARYVKRPIPPQALPKPMFGDRTNLAEAYRRTKEAYRNHQIDRRTYVREIQTIYRLNQALKSQGQQAAVQKEKNNVREEIMKRKRSW